MSLFDSNANQYNYGYDDGFDQGSRSEQTKIIQLLEKIQKQYHPDEWKEKALITNLIVAIKKGEHEKEFKK